jgi:hypothetical protein
MNAAATSIHIFSLSLLLDLNSAQAFPYCSIIRLLFCNDQIQCSVISDDFNFLRMKICFRFLVTTILLFYCCQNLKNILVHLFAVLGNSCWNCRFCHSHFNDFNARSTNNTIPLKSLLHIHILLLLFEIPVLQLPFTPPYPATGCLWKPAIPSIQDVNFCTSTKRCH